MIRATVVGGFLGAGKTTWLGQRLREENSVLSECCVISNDFADEGVDDWLITGGLPGDLPEVISITGGCVCCDASDHLLDYLVTLVERGHRVGGHGVSRIFLETSGVADPAAVVRHIANHPVLRHNLVVDEFVCLVDGFSGLDHLLQGNLDPENLSLADKVVLTKADIADPDVLAEVRGVVASVAPAAELVGSSFGLPYTLPDSSAREAPVLKLIGSEKPEATVLSVGLGVVWEEYALWLEMLLWARPHQVLRTKGIIRTPAGPLVLQSVSGSIQQPTLAPAAAVPAHNTSMVFITQGLETGLLKESFARFVPSARQGGPAAAA